jgi:hypothetical protein
MSRAAAEQARIAYNAWCAPEYQPEEVPKDLPFLVRLVTRGRFHEPGNYRYRLIQRWDSGPMMGWLLMNPSIANDEKDDKTVVRCRNYARAWGFGAMEIVNVAAHVATHSKDLAQVADPIGSDNRSYIIMMALHSELIVAAYGQPAFPALRAEGLKACKLILDNTMRKLHVLELSQNGTPKHPLYLAADLKPVPWNPFPQSIRKKLKV